MRDNATNNIKERAMRRGGGAQAGQSLVVAVIVLFLLLFLGGIFVAMIARNLRSAQEAGQRTSAAGFSEAGLRYLDEQLTTSPEGADWRPVPDASTNTQDPDYFWTKPYQLNATTGQYEGGFTRVNFGGPTAAPGNLSGGRALVRVTYRPRADDPTSKYIKLESVGRVGYIDPVDPTTFGNTERVGLRRELVAYKAIGITDYVRSIWNKDNKPVNAQLGAPFSVFDRAAADAAPTPRDIVSEYRGPVRVNANLTFYGENRFTLIPERNDVIEVAGTIGLNNVDPSTTTVAANDPSRVFVNTTAEVPNVFPSESTEFSTIGGLVRDGQSFPDKQGAIRGVSRLAPPLIDASIGDGGLTRYRALTRNSEPMAPADAGGVTVDPDRGGFSGWGTGLWINNRNDVQRESETLFGTYSLRSDWLEPNTPTGRASYWRGDFLYVPPAVTITLTPRYMVITRSPYDNERGVRAPFFTAAGARVQEKTILRYTNDGAPAPATGIAAGVRNEVKFAGYPAAPDPANANTLVSDFVIFAEGNVRIRGIVGGTDPEAEGKKYLRRLTVVSNATIYVDGSLLRDNLPANDADHGRSSIALLAKDYVAVNTTQFLNPADLPWQPEANSGDNRAFFLPLDADPTRQRFPFLLTPGPIDENNTPSANNFSLFLRHSSEFTNSTPGTDGAVVNLFVNDDYDPANGPELFDFSGGNNQFNLRIPSQNYVYDVFSLSTDARIRTGVGVDNVLALNYDLGNTSRATYKLTRFGVAPLDVRIEAFLYAQEGSFFIIPGPWFNPDANDTYQTYVANEPDQAGGQRPRNRRAGENANDPDVQVNPLYPFYREPMDVRLTIFGTVAENLPAQVGDQGAWLEKWGWVPRYYGSTGLPNSTPQAAVTLHGPEGALGAAPGSAQRYGTGLVYDFNDYGVLPYQRTVANNTVNYDYNRPVREDPYRNTRLTPGIVEPLPIVPRLPVAQGLLYFGESSRQQ